MEKDNYNSFKNFYKYLKDEPLGGFGIPQGIITHVNALELQLNADLTTVPKPVYGGMFSGKLPQLLLPANLLPANNEQSVGTPQLRPSVRPSEKFFSNTKKTNPKSGISTPNRVQHEISKSNITQKP
jgi:hypothetical protein